MPNNIESADILNTQRSEKFREEHLSVGNLEVQLLASLYGRGQQGVKVYLFSYIT